MTLYVDLISAIAKAAGLSGWAGWFVGFTASVAACGGVIFLALAFVVCCRRRHVRQTSKLREEQTHLHKQTLLCRLAAEELGTFRLRQADRHDDDDDDHDDHHDHSRDAAAHAHDD